uniref:Uncharacterized protein n=1 Tax=Anguilla anguilla TaxID=7936 RepID=A0A0E9RM34_ANGAN
MLPCPSSPTVVEEGKEMKANLRK